MSVRVLRYTEDYYEQLVKFSNKIWPNKSKEYIDYRLQTVANNKYNILLLNEEDNIVGCNLFFSTKILIENNEELVYWSNDTYVEKDYRGESGTLLMFEILSSEHLGLGLSDINKKIYKKVGKKFGVKFITKSYRYMIPNFWSIKFILHRLKLINIAKTDVIFHFPDKVKNFKRVNNVNEFNIPNDGYWFSNYADLDFIRDADFFNYRFFNNFNKYWVYKLNLRSKYDECYFVVRPIIEGGVLTLSLVDFRFNTNNPEQFIDILKAARKISYLNKLPLLTISTSLSDNFFPKFAIKTKGYRDFVTNYKSMKDVKTIVITRADSDGDKSFKQLIQYKEK